MADFGFAQHFFAADGELGFRGSPLYMAPEMFTKQPYDASVDLWSIGVILLVLLWEAGIGLNYSVKEESNIKACSPTEASSILWPSKENKRM